MFDGEKCKICINKCYCNIYCDKDFDLILEC